VQLLDPFGRIVVEGAAQPWHGNVPAGQVDMRQLPLVGSLPAGRYGLRVLVRTEDGTERSPVTDEGVLIPADQIPPLPVAIHPPARLPETAAEDVQPLAVFDTGIALLGAEPKQDDASAGDWLRFSLLWQVEQPLEVDLTVFTQLLGPDGQVWGQHDNQPGGGWYGVPLWRPNQPVVDDYAFQLDPNTPPGTYRLIAGLYHTDTLKRSLTQTGADFVEIGTVIVAGGARTE
jgi:hypothetical protein